MIRALVLGVLLAGAAPAGAASIITAIVSDPLTGIAIDGYDPVGYFTEGEPTRGLSDYEYIWGGVPWFFASAANRDAFIGAPEVYAPQFGGHCAMSASRGRASQGNPQLYAIVGQRLYLFYSSGNREAFLLSPAAAVERGFANWEKLAAAL